MFDHIKLRLQQILPRNLPTTTMAPPSGFFSLPGEERNEIYLLLLREMPESGATLTISPGGDETYQFAISREYFGLLAANKQVYQEFKTLAARVYTSDDFEKEVKKDKRPLQVKKIIFNKPLIDVHAIPHVRFQLTGGGIAPMTDLMRWSMTSIYLREFEANVELHDGLGNTFVGKFTFSWDDRTSAALEFQKGIMEYTKAIAQIERNVRNVIFRMRNRTHDCPVAPSPDPRYCEWLENNEEGVVFGAKTKIRYHAAPGFCALGFTWMSVSIKPKAAISPPQEADAGQAPPGTEQEAIPPASEGDSMEVQLDTEQEEKIKYRCVCIMS